MPATPPYAAVRCSVNGGAATAGARTVASGDTIQLSGESTAQWTSQRWTMYAMPPGYPAPAGWSTDANGYHYSTAVTPPPFTISNPATRWGKYAIRLVVNDGIFAGVTNAQMTDETLALSLPSPLGQVEIFAGETTQFGTSWAKPYQDNLRTLEGAIGAAAGTPTGTGIPHVVGGVMNAAASAIVNADVDAAAAIALSKIVNPTGTGVVKTTAGAINAASSLIANADVDAAAAIALSKVVNPTGTGLVKATAGAFDAAASLLVNADVHASAAIALSKLAPLVATEDISTAGTLNDLALATASTVPITMVRLTDAGALDLTGVAGGASGRIVILLPVGAGGLTVRHENAGSTAENRILIAGAADFTVVTDAPVVLLYDSTTARWRAGILRWS